MSYPTCPTCRERIWRYKGNVWTCANGHTSGVDEAEGKVWRTTPPRRRRLIALSGFVGSILGAAAMFAAEKLI